MDLQAQLREVIDKVNAIATANGVSIDDLSSSYQRFNSVIGESANKLVDLAAAYGQSKAAAELSSKMMGTAFQSVYEEIAMGPKRLAAEIAGSNVFGMMSDASEKMNQQARDLQTSLYSFNKQLAADVVQAGNGIPVQLDLVYENSSQLTKSYMNNVLKETRLFNAGLEAMSSEQGYSIAKTTQLMTDGLKINASVVTAIYQDEFSRTGKITGKFAEDFAATIIATEKVTGINRRAISEDMQKLAVDFENFGNKSVPQLAALSVSMRQLGLDMEDVTRVSSKFTSFEGATQAISNIAAVTGASLDTMELFYLANEDKEEFFKTLKQNLIDQGVSLETLSHQEQVYLSKQLGFNSVKQFQTLINSEIEGTTQSYSDLIEAASESADVRGKALDDELAKSGGLTREMEYAVQNAQKGLETTAKLYAGTEEFARGIQKLSIEASKNATEALPLWSSGMETTGDAIKVLAESGVIAFDKLGEAFDDMLDKMDFKKLYRMLEPYIGRSPSPVMEGVIDGFQSGFDFVAKNMKSSTLNIGEIITELSKTSGQVTKPLEDAIKKVDDLRTKLKPEEFAKFEQEIFQKEKAKLENLEDTLGLINEDMSAGFIEQKLKERLKDQFSAEDYKAIASAYKGGKDEDLRSAISNIAGRQIAEMAGTTPAGEGAKKESTTTTTKVEGEASINITVKIDGAELERLIDTRIEQATDGGIKVTSNAGSGQGIVKLAITS